MYKRFPNIEFHTIANLCFCSCLFLLLVMFSSIRAKMEVVGPPQVSLDLRVPGKAQRALEFRVNAAQHSSFHPSCPRLGLVDARL